MEKDAEVRRLTVVAVDVPDDMAGRLAAFDGLRLVELRGQSEHVAGVVERESADAVLIAMRDDLADVRAACRSVRGDPRTSGVPLLVWGRRGARDEEVDAFRAGADDYISASPTVAALAARIRAITRRFVSGTPVAGGISTSSTTTMNGPEMNHTIRVGLLTVEADSYRLRIDGRSVALTAGEFRMLWKLAVNVGTVVTNDQLARVNGRGHDVPSDKSVRSCIAGLRRKMGSVAVHLQTVRGVGYRLVEQ